MSAPGGHSVRTRRAVWWALGFSAVTVLLRLPFLRLPFDPTDEGYYAAAAQATARGARLYADLWYVRPPLLNTAYALAYRASLGARLPYDLSVRLLAAIVAAATVGVVAWFLFEELSFRAAFLGSTVAILMAASLALQNEANAETWLLLPYALSALLVLWVALHEPASRRALWLLALAGALTGVSGAFKQVALVDLGLPILAWLAFDRAHVRRWLRLWAAFLAGALAVWTVLLAVVAVRDDVRAFLYFAWFRNVAYASTSYARIDALRLAASRLTGPLVAFTVVAVVALLLLAVGAFVSRDVSLTTCGIALFALGWLGLSAIGVSASGRFYQHYFIQATVPLVLLLAASADLVLAAAEKKRLASLAFAAMLALAVVPPALSWAADVRSTPATFAARQVYKDLGGRLPRLTRPGGTILVWGIFASVRAYCPLPHATRLIVACYDYGWSPVDRGHLLGEEFPSTADVVLSDIGRNPPDTIVLTVPLNPSTSAAMAHANDGVRLTAALSQLVSSQYEVIEHGSGYEVLRRGS